MKKKFNIEQLNTNDINKLFNFRKKLFPDNNRRDNIDLWKWRYIDNPYIYEGIPVWVIKNNDKIVGSIASTSVKIKINNRNSICSFGNDFFVEKEFLGLPSLQLLKIMISKSEINIMSYFSESAKKLYLKMKYYDLSEYFLSHSINFNATVTFKRRVKLLVLSFVRTLFFREKYTVEVYSSFTELINPFLEKISNNLKNCIIKDREYFMWRYDKCPNRDFNYIVIMNNGLVKGVAITTDRIISDVDCKHGVIMDLVISSGDRKSSVALIQACLNHFKEKNCTESYTHMMRGWIDFSFLLTGFYSANVSKLGFMVRSNFDKSLFVDNFNLSFGDIDVFE